MAQYLDITIHQLVLRVALSALEPHTAFLSFVVSCCAVCFTRLRALVTVDTGYYPERGRIYIRLNRAEKFSLFQPRMPRPLYATHEHMPL